jgi:hypothetical protein
LLSTRKWKHIIKIAPIIKKEVVFGRGRLVAAMGIIYLDIIDSGYAGMVFASDHEQDEKTNMDELKAKLKTCLI